MSDGDICSDNERYGGFGAAIANSLCRRDRAAPARAVAADSAAARAVAAVAVARAPGTKKPPPVTVAENTWLTKRPYKRQNKSNVPVPAPQAAAPATAPAPVPLVRAGHSRFSADPETFDLAEQRLFYKNNGYCLASIISTLPRYTM